MPDTAVDVLRILASFYPLIMLLVLVGMAWPVLRDYERPPEGLDDVWHDPKEVHHA